MWWLTGIALAGVRCDADALDKGHDALRVVTRSRPELAATALVEACRLPPAVEDTLGMIPASPPEMRPTVDLRLAVDAADDWTRACPGGPSVLVTAFERAPAGRRALIWDRCDLAAHGVTDAATWADAPGLLVAPVLARLWLAEAGAEPATIGAYVRALAGLPDQPPPRVIREFNPLYP